MLVRGITVAAVAIAALLAACGGKTRRDWTGTGTEEPADSTGTGGTASNNGLEGGVGAAGSSGSAACTPDCEGKECGDDGCGSRCAPGCAISQTCNAGQCDDLVYGPEGPSCAGMTGTECNGESCCTSIVLPAGSFPMGRGTETCRDCIDGCPSGMEYWDDEQPEHPATVSSFSLDKYQVTVGRFRAFVQAYDGTPPPPGAGAHPLIAGSGWDSAWDSNLPGSQSALASSIACNPGQNPGQTAPGLETWTPTAGEHNQYPMNCVNWYEAFAFCIWDGGRLPTEAEWEYAAAGGEENRLYPWGNDTTEPLPANYGGNHSTPYLAVGSEPGGNGRWGHADLAGSTWEWLLDWYVEDWYTTTQGGSSDCAALTADSAASRVVRGGVWNHAATSLRAALRRSASSFFHFDSCGIRCARSAP